MAGKGLRAGRDIARPVLASVRSPFPYPPTGHPRSGPAECLRTGTPPQCVFVPNRHDDRIDALSVGRAGSGSTRATRATR
jgi:hypothetical protein